MKRRNFIITAAAATSAFAIPELLCGCGSAQLPDPALNPEILTRFCDKDTIKNIGGAYLSLMPMEKEKDRLKELIMGNYDNSKPADDEKVLIRQWISKKIGDDFRSKRIQIIDGWILAVTEARQCALFSLEYK